MPFPLLAHQAPILPLKRWWPNAWCLPGLVLGSIAPDWEYLQLRAPRAPGLGHSPWWGPLVWTPALTLILLLTGALDVGGACSRRLSPRFAILRGIGRETASRAGFARTVWSIAIAVESHVAFDVLTHRIMGPLLRPMRLWRGSFGVGGPTQAQLLATLAGSIVTLWMLRGLATSSVVDEKPNERKRGGSLLLIGALAGAALAWHRFGHVIRKPIQYFDAGPILAAGYVTFAMITGAALGSYAIALLMAVADRLPRANAAPPRAP